MQYRGRRNMLGGGVLRGRRHFYAVGDAEDYFLQEASGYLPEGTAAIIPIHDIIQIFFTLFLPDLLQDDEVGGEAAPIFIVVLFVQVGIIDIEVGDARLYLLREVFDQMADRRAKEVGASCLYLVTKKVTDDAVELSIVAGGPESVFRPRVEAAEKEVEVAPEMICQDQEPHLVGRADIEDAFEAEGAGGQVYFRGRVEMDIAPGGFPIFVERQQKAGIA